MIIEYIGTIGGLSGAFLLAKKKRIGFLCWIISNIAWIIYGISTGGWGLVLQFAIFWILAIYGYINWGDNVKT